MPSAPWLLDGVAVVTGAARGVGLAVARRLAERGAQVVLAGREGAEAEAAHLSQGGFAAHSARVDVSSEEEMMALGALAASLGPLCAWVNNAGISHRAPLVDLAIADWDRVMAVNARGTFLGTREAARRMIAGGAVVNIASISAFAALPELVHYGASKGAVVALTQHARLRKKSDAVQREMERNRQAGCWDRFLRRLDPPRINLARPEGGKPFSAAC